RSRWGGPYSGTTLSRYQQTVPPADGSGVSTPEARLFPRRGRCHSTGRADERPRPAENTPDADVLADPTTSRMPGVTGMSESAFRISSGTLRRTALVSAQILLVFLTLWAVRSTTKHLSYILIPLAVALLLTALL